MNNKSYKLLNQTAKIYLIFSFLILLISTPLFYYFIENLYIEEADESLILRRDEFLNTYSNNYKEENIAIWNQFNRDIKIKKGFISKDTVFFTSYFDTLSAENEPYREINSPILINQKPYIFVAKVNLVESEDLLENIAFIFILLVILLLNGIYFINRQLSISLWKPFYKTLDQIETFQIDKNYIPSFLETNIDEFNRLNESILKLIVKNTEIYNSQREFIENAAHELQTPLAVFQAKIDNFIQKSDITLEQSEILNSLNENIFRLNRLNKNLLLLSKLENNSFPEKQKISLNNYLNKNIDFFKEQAEFKQIQIKINLPFEIKIESNSILLEVFLNNLFQNAIKHNIQNGVIFIELIDNKLYFKNTGKNKELNKNQLFKRFSKENSSENGTGLGLSIIKKIADINNWKIEYSFDEGIHCFCVDFIQ